MFVLKGKTFQDNFSKNIYAAIKMLKKYKINRSSKSGLKYLRRLHGNEPEHKARFVTGYLYAENFTVLLFLLSYLAPCDFVLLERKNSQNAFVFNVSMYDGCSFWKDEMF